MSCKKFTSHDYISQCKARPILAISGGFKGGGAGAAIDRMHLKTYENFAS